MVKDSEAVVMVGVALPVADGDEVSVGLNEAEGDSEKVVDGDTSLVGVAEYVRDKEFEYDNELDCVYEALVSLVSEAERDGVLVSVDVIVYSVV